ncbi:protein DBF4 homolog B isoform X2 [Takifugu flavidus]|uniref:protein DBF4 homolog B isoform X2 n=1 Tax=Takifugu flavidus TaxID=433684 RepID=UPI002544A12C|nr:protein DBF4 homolog B isoform X2 [Takifugu flavidus]
MQQQLQAEQGGLLGALVPGKRKLLGKTFYLDNVKKRPAALILETISLLGGDVSFVVTGSQEYLKQQKRTDEKVAEKGTNDETPHPTKAKESVVSKEKQRTGNPRPMACGSRGKALLEKAIRNSELHKSSVLANAQSWGVKILYVDDFLLYLKRLTRESLSKTHKRPEKTDRKQGSHVVKATILKSPYLKIEDVSRKYKPLHMQSLTFPSLWYSGQFSPFESPPPLFEKHNKSVEAKTREKKKSKNCTEDKPLTPPSCTPSPLQRRKKDLSFCECCHQHFSNLEEHLHSDHHRAFALDISNYAHVDQLVAEMVPGFTPKLPTRCENMQNRPLTPISIQDICELEPIDDIEAEHEVRALQRRGSSLSDHISSPHRGPCVFRPVSLSPELSLTLSKPPILSPGIQPFTVDTSGLITGTSSPVMPLLAVEAHDFDPSCQLRDTRDPVSSSDVLCPSLDPYSQPPVLSPQVPFIMEPHSPYSEPPVLSPKQKLKEHMLEIDVVSSVNITNTQEVEYPSPQSVLELGQSECHSSDLRSITPFSGRSRSLPRQSTVAQNPKKRCRSASLGNSGAKKRRISLQFCCSDCLTAPLKPGSDVLASPEAWLSDKGVGQVKQQCPQPIVPACTTGMAGFKQTFAPLSAPSAQTFSRRLNQTDTSVLQQQSDKCPSTDIHTCSQACQPSGAHSTSVCIESVLIPDLAILSSSSSDSDWDREVLAKLGQTSVTPLLPTDQDFELDKDLLHRPCAWMQDSSYESRLHTALQPSDSGKPLCGEDMDSSAFSRTVVKIVEVQH